MTTDVEFKFRPATREQIRLLLGISGASGSGKTFSAMKLAKGLAGDKRFAVVDTENGRASMYADYFQFDVVELSAPFTPERYLSAITAAEKAGYPVVVVDSMSHEWSGDGGILDMQEDELDRMAGDNWQKRESCKMASWIKPKMAHKAMVAHLLQLRAHVVMCFRAEAKIEMEKNERGKWEMVPKKSLTGLDGWIPITEKNLPYELTASFLMTANNPGLALPIKLQAQHRPFFDLSKPMTEESGRLINEWAKGGSPTVAPLPPKQVSTQPPLVETKPGVYETPPPESAVTKMLPPVEMLKAIERAKSERSLKRLGEDIAKSNYSKEDRDLMRDVFAAKMKMLKAPAPAVVEPDPEPPTMNTEEETII